MATVNNNSNPDIFNEIAEIIGNSALALSINKAIKNALAYSFIRLEGGQNVSDVFNHSLLAVARDINAHPRGKLVRRLIEWGHHDPDCPPDYNKHGKEILSDIELGKCIEFIFSYMINRFKGELAELLALEPCCHLFAEFLSNGIIPSGTLLYWGETIQEPDCKGYYKKGADGLIIEHTDSDIITILGTVEIKSMVRSFQKVLDQIDKHIKRLDQGLSLNKYHWSPHQLHINKTEIIRIAVQPSKWKLSREWNRQEYTGQDIRRAIFTPDSSPQVIFFPKSETHLNEAQATQMEPKLWKIILPWSHEALAQAAFEMTFWYMGQIGKQIYSNKTKPQYLAYMTLEEIGLNRVKEMLRNAPLRPITEHQAKRAEWLYNAYCFGYPIGADNKEMIFLPGEIKQAD
jgi:hypothetical protein